MPLSSGSIPKPGDLVSSKASSQAIRVTVVVTAYNRREFVLDALRSVINQTLPREDFDVILITNFTEPLLQEFCRANNIKTLCFEGGIGEYIAAGLRQANGEVMAFLDDDDMWTSDRLQRITTFFANLPDLGFYHNAVQYVSRAGDPVQFTRSVERRSASRESEPLLLRGPERFRRFQLLVDRNAGFNISSMAIRRDILLDHIATVRRTLSAQDELLFVLACFSDLSICVDPRPMTLYRLSEKNVSAKNTGAGKVAELERQLLCLANLQEVGQSLPRPAPGEVMDYLSLLQAEYETIEWIFRPDTTRAQVFRSLPPLLRRYLVSNALKIRLLLFGSLAVIISPDVISRVFFQWLAASHHSSERGPAS